jgi:hypothetical protein
VLAASDGQEPSCAIDLSWNAATSVCPGPLSYFVYRSTSSPVPIVPANLVASGVTDTTHTDSYGIARNTLYRYVVRAVDASSGESDLNLVERSGKAVAAGPGIGALPCASGTVGPVPSPVPDGAASTEPLRGSRETLAGDVIAVTWDPASCPSTDYNLLWGDLGGIATWEIDGVECAVGTSGTFLWSDAPSGSVWFLMVGTDGDGVESRWGDATSGERNGLAVSGACGTFLKSTVETCP